MQGVCGELERCRTPDEQDEVEKLIKKVFAKLPEDFKEAEHEKALRANGLCRVRCIKRLTQKMLEDLGISMPRRRDDDSGRAAGRLTRHRPTRSNNRATLC